MSVTYLRPARREMPVARLPAAPADALIQWIETVEWYSVVPIYTVCAIQRDLIRQAWGL